MVETITIIIFIISFVAGYILALSLLTKSYQKKIMDVLDFLRFSDKIGEEEYNHYKEKYVIKQDSVRNLTETIKKFRKKGESKNE